MKMWTWVGVGVVIVALLWLVMSMQQPAQTNNTDTTNEPDSVQDTSDQDIGVAATPISYANALIKYADRRIQLDPLCQAHPNNVTYKDNTGIMIDNRSSKTRTVKVGTTFTIKPWGFKIVVLPDVYLKSKTLLVDCDGSQNVATVLVQE